MKKTIKKVSLFALIIGSASFFGVVNALPMAECSGMYRSCMDTWYTTQGGCADQYFACRET